MELNRSLKQWYKWELYFLFEWQPYGKIIIDEPLLRKRKAYEFLLQIIASELKSEDFNKMIMRTIVPSKILKTLTWFTCLNKKEYDLLGLNKPL